jgi:hypothetical protein
MAWVVEESGDCGVSWRRAELTHRYYHPLIAVLEALEIIKDEWRPPERSLRQLIDALQDDLVAYYWHQAIRIVREDHAISAPAVWQ